MAIALQLLLALPPSLFISFSFSISPSISIYLFPFLFLPCFPSSLQATLSSLAKVRWVSTGFSFFFFFLNSQNPPLPKHCLLMTGSYEAKQETHFKDVSTPVWIGSYCSNTHRHGQARNFICLPNLWLRHIKIKMTVCVKAELGGLD